MGCPSTCGRRVHPNMEHICVVLLDNTLICNQYYLGYYHITRLHTGWSSYNLILQFFLFGDNKEQELTVNGKVILQLGLESVSESNSK